MNVSAVLFILLAVVVLYLLFSKYTPWPGPCIPEHPIPKEIVKKIKVWKTPRPEMSSKVYSFPSDTTTIVLEWTCDFSNSRYSPEKVNFVLFTQGGDEGHKLIHISYADSYVDHTGELYSYRYENYSSTGFSNAVYYALLRSVSTDAHHRLISTPSQPFRVTIGSCVKQCLTKQCGDDGCGDPEGCGSCPEWKMCSNGVCVCVPECTGKQCGDDGCDNPDGCGVCSGNKTCQNGQCICTPNCEGKHCGELDGCGGKCTVQTCHTNSDSCVNGSCRCGTAPACGGTTDTCIGGQCYCGTESPCPQGQYCIDGVCQIQCFYRNTDSGYEACCDANGTKTWKGTGGWEFYLVDNCSQCENNSTYPGGAPVCT